ncbi:MAG: hydroxymethylglutaryl-CoA lyase [Chitinophagaceae bacterium]|nr:hydroxymethylglutaryl-CoA lyase [Chitinophagaceae bacterium]
MQNFISLIECPRDAMQGWRVFIPTEKKVQYLNELLKAGFHTLDFGSFVSPKAIPQMADTKDVIAQLDMGSTKTRLLAIVANVRGAEEAVGYEQISCLGFPFSVSPTFQQRNANSSIEESFQRVKQIQKLCMAKGKELVIYLSMGFGNPYGDPYSEEIVFEWANKMAELDIKTISLADTVGLATPEQVFRITYHMVNTLPHLEIGVHLHSSPDNWKQKLESALQAGCRRFDGAIKGIGGCPMANDELVGNMNTEWMVKYFKDNNYTIYIDELALKYCSRIANSVFF